MTQPTPTEAQIAELRKLLEKATAPGAHRHAWMFAAEQLMKAAPSLLALAELGLVARKFLEEHGEEVPGAFAEAMDGELDEEIRAEMRATAMAYRGLLESSRSIGGTG